MGRVNAETKLRVRIDEHQGFLRHSVAPIEGLPTSYIIDRKGWGRRGRVHGAEKQEIAEARAKLRAAYGDVRLTTERVKVDGNNEVVTKQRGKKTVEEAVKINDRKVDKYERSTAQHQKAEAAKQRAHERALEAAKLRSVAHHEVDKATALEATLPNEHYIWPGGFAISHLFMGKPKSIVEGAFKPDTSELDAHFTTSGMLKRLSKGALNPNGHQNIFEQGVTLLEKVGVFEAIMNRFPGVSEITGTYITGVNLLSSDSARAKRAAIGQLILTDVPAALGAFGIVVPPMAALEVFSFVYTQLYNSAKMADIRDRIDQQVELANLGMMHTLFTDPELKNSALANTYRSEFVHAMTKGPSMLHELAYQLHKDVVQPAANVLHAAEERVPGITHLAGELVEHARGDAEGGVRGHHVHKAVGTIHEIAETKLAKPESMEDHTRNLLAEANEALADESLPAKYRRKMEVAKQTAELLLSTLEAARS